MVDYRYTELAYKITPLFCAPAVWVVLVWLIRRLMREWCHFYAILIELLQQKYVQYISIICSCYATCKAFPFIIAVSYTQVPTAALPTDSRVVYELPLYDTLYIIELQCTFSVVAIVSSLIQVSSRLARINEPKGADKG